MGDFSQMSDGDRVQYLAGVGGMDSTAGIGATLQDQIDRSNPREALMASEEAQSQQEQEEREAEKFEKMGFLSMFLRYVIREDYVQTPQVSNRLLWSLVMQYYPSLVSNVPREVQEEQLSAQFYIRPGKDVTMSEIVGAEDSVRREAFRSFLEMVVFHKMTARDPMLPTKKLYALAKSFFPALIGDMSLDGIGGIFPDETEMSEKGRRAKWSWRIKEWIAKPMKERGYVHHLIYNKSATASIKLSEAAKKTCNRRKKQ